MNHHSVQTQETTPILRVILLVEYYGPDFAGSQLQQNAYTVQQALYDALKKLNIRLHGALHFAGRTDAGVHAKGQVAHFDVLAEGLRHIPELNSALNAVLPKSISIKAHVISTDPEFHSIIAARWRWYRYRIFNQPLRSVWMRSDAAWIKYPLDATAMQQGAEHFLGEQDFESFKCPHTEINNNICRVIHSKVWQDDEYIVFDIVANRFVYKMVRNLTGMLLKIGQHSDFTPEDIPLVIQRKSRQHPAPTAHPEGLSLMAVEYPEPWDFFRSDVYVTTLNQIAQESSRYEKNLFRKAS